MKSNYLAFLIGVIFFTACRKSELSPLYTVDFSKTESTMTISANGIWVDTIYYNISPAQNEECIVSLIGIYKTSSISDGLYESQYPFEIIAQTNQYIVYKAESLIDIENVNIAHLIITANAKVVGTKQLSIKTVTGSNIFDIETGDSDGEVVNPVSSEEIFYNKENTSIEKQYIGATETTLIQSFSSDLIEGFSMSSDKKNYAISLGYSHRYYTVGNTSMNNYVNKSGSFIGINNDGEAYYISDNYVSTYYNLFNNDSENFTQLVFGNTSTSDLVSVAAESSDIFYYIERYKSNGLYSTTYSEFDFFKIKDTDGNIYVNEGIVTLNYLKDLTLSDDGTMLAFVQNNRTLKTINISSGLVSTVYSITTGEISTPDFNGDRTKLAFSLDNGSQSDIYVVSISGTGITNATNTTSTNEYMPQW